MDDPTLLSWIDRGQSVAMFLVAIGVAGEFLGHWMAKPALARIEAARNAEMQQANERVAQLEKDKLQLQKDILEAELSLADRALPIETDATRKLETFTPIEAVIAFTPDPECARTASQIATLLQMSKWKVARPSPTPPGTSLMPGVIVRVNTWAETEFRESTSKESVMAREAVDALVAELKSKKIKARKNLSPHSDPLNRILVEVGLRPSPLERRLLQEWLDKSWPKDVPRPKDPWED